MKMAISFERREPVPNVIQEFSRFAHQYNKYNMIQAQVAKELVNKLSLDDYSSVLDIGCGSGEVFKNLQQQSISLDCFIAFDSSQNMLDIHPSSQTVTKVCADFNDKNFLEALPTCSYDLLLSSSALQWSKDLEFTLGSLAKLSKIFYGAIFTSGTFKTLHHVANVTSPIYTAKTLQENILKHYDDVNFELHRYTLHFNSVREMFGYIKKSGVSGGEKQLSYGETKHLMGAYPLDYLEFEVLFVNGSSKVFTSLN